MKRILLLFLSFHLLSVSAALQEVNHNLTYLSRLTSPTATEILSSMAGQRISSILARSLTAVVYKKLGLDPRASTTLSALPSIIIHASTQACTSIATKLLITGRCKPTDAAKDILKQAGARVLFLEVNQQLGVVGPTTDLTQFHANGWEAQAALAAIEGDIAGVTTASLQAYASRILY